MSKQPIKLTDDLIDRLVDAAKAEIDMPLHEALAALDAIRALRDRARSVCEGARPDPLDDATRSWVDDEKLDALREVLP